MNRTQEPSDGPDRGRFAFDAERVREALRLETPQPDLDHALTALDSLESRVIELEEALREIAMHPITGHRASEIAAIARRALGQKITGPSPS